jgi:Protein of unknown function (DUF3224)
MSKAKGTFEVGSWDESAVLEANGGPKITQAKVSMSFEGDVEGEGTVEWLMGYDGDEKTAAFVGLERVVGKIGTKKGSFVPQHVGSFDGKLATSKLRVVPGSGTGELDGLRGTGTFEAGMGSEGVRSFSLDYDL